VCLKAKCSNCHHVTWAGCSNHIANVMDQVPKNECCTCTTTVKNEGKEYPPQGSYMSAGEVC
ncbi:hypothetical protein B0T26DRAFT_646524, partial [Lasiosphaeria miniovina]